MSFFHIPRVPSGYWVSWCGVVARCLGVKVVIWVALLKMGFAVFHASQVEHECVIVTPTNQVTLLTSILTIHWSV